MNKTKLNILCIAHDLPPLTTPQSFQITKLVSAISNWCNLHVVSSVPFNINQYSSFCSHKPEFVSYTSVEDIQSGLYARVIKLRLMPLLFKTPDLHKRWAKKVISKTIASFPARSVFDKIITFSYPLSSNIIGQTLKQYYHCEWIAHNSDPWVAHQFNNFGYFTKRLNQAWESTCFLSADKLVFTSEETKALYQSKYPGIGNNMYVLNHAFDPKLFTPFQHNDSCKNKVIIRHIGQFYGPRTPEPLFKALAISKDKDIFDKINIELVGAGRLVPALIKKYGLSKGVTQKKPVPYIESLELMSSASVLLLVDADLKQISVYFPSKLADYMGAKKPILIISPEGTCSRLAKELDLMYSHPKDLDKIIEHLQAIAAGVAMTPKFENFSQFEIQQTSQAIKKIMMD
jgi:glycosyltransferase involved in cell wall biosynthesis